MKDLTKQKKLFDGCTVKDFFQLINGYDESTIVKLNIAKFVMSTFNGSNFIIKTKDSDIGRLVSNKQEQLSFVEELIRQFEIDEEYELCAELTTIKTKLTAN